MAYLAKMVGVDEQPLTKEAKNHFQLFRFRCRNPECNKDFCCVCKVGVHVLLSAILHRHL